MPTVLPLNKTSDRAAASPVQFSDPDEIGREADARLDGPGKHATAPRPRVSTRELEMQSRANKAGRAFGTLPGRTVVAKFDNNGGRPAVIYVPPGFRPKAKARLVISFHGMNGNIGIDLTRNGTIERLRELGDEGNAIYVFPQGDRSGVSFNWMNGMPSEVFSRFVFEAREVAEQMLKQRITTYQITVVAHSSGGLALYNIIESGCLPLVRKLVCLDCFYTLPGVGADGKFVAKNIDEKLAEALRRHEQPLEIEDVLSSNEEERHLLVARVARCNPLVQLSNLALAKEEVKSEFKLYPASKIVHSLLPGSYLRP